MKKRRQEWESNRDMARRPYKTKFWCDGCDADLVGPGNKCKTCKKKDCSKKYKK